MSWRTCAACDTDLYPRLARRTDEGWVCSVCPRACGDCGTEISAKATSGLCRRCYKRRERGFGRRSRGVEQVRDPRPCIRCGLSTRAKVQLCKDCRDVLGDEIARWVA